MKILLKFILIVFSFILSFELLAFISIDNNVITMDKESLSYYDVKNKETAYFVGDSYASTDYASENYPVIFREYFKTRGWNFVDLSKANTELADHEKLLDSVGKLNPKLIIYFYNISDIVSLNEDILITKSADKSTVKQNWNPRSIGRYIYNRSKSVVFLKESLQYLSLSLTGRFLPGTPGSIYPRETLAKKQELKRIFQNIKAEHLLILINTPINAGKSPRNWEQYDVFNTFSKTSQYDLIQAVDIIEDTDFALSFRNGHPNQEAIKIIAADLIAKFDQIK